MTELDTGRLYCIGILFELNFGHKRMCQKEKVGTIGVWSVVFSGSIAAPIVFGIDGIQLVEAADC